MLTLRSALLATLAGFLTRPCCVIPAALSLAGVSSAGLSSVFMTHRPLFAALSAGCLGVSGWLTLRRGGSRISKWVTVVASLVAFFVSAGFSGVLDVF